MKLTMDVIVCQEMGRIALNLVRGGHLANFNCDFKITQIESLCLLVKK